MTGQQDRSSKKMESTAHILQPIFLDVGLSDDGYFRGKWDEPNCPGCSVSSRPHTLLGEMFC